MCNYVTWNVQCTCDIYITSVYVHCTDAVDLIFRGKSKLRQCIDYKDPGFTNKPDCFQTIIPPPPPAEGQITSLLYPVTSLEALTECWYIKLSVCQYVCQIYKLLYSISLSVCLFVFLAVCQWVHHVNKLPLVYCSTPPPPSPWFMFKYTQKEREKIVEI